MPTLTRRGLLAACVATAAASRAGRARGADPPSPQVPRDLTVRDFVLDADPALGNRLVLCVPAHLAPDERVPLLVALHGAAETTDPRTGAFAFVERYGLLGAYERLRRPPVARTLAKADYFGDARLAELNAALVGRPFRGIAIACPCMPNVARAERPAELLDRYASFITDVVVPKARAEAPVFTDAARTSIDGVSLGGYAGLEVFLRRPDAFGAWGCVQGALGSARVAAYAERLASVSRKRAVDLHLETSTNDPYHDTTVSLSGALIARGIPNDLLVHPGPHDQVWLRESGVIGMLQWHDARPR